MSRKIVLTAMSSFALLLTACQPFNPNEYLMRQRNNILLQGNSASYADGYTDGCATGRREAGDHHFIFQKNATRAKNDTEYVEGWEQGHNFCRQEHLNQKEHDYREEKSALLRQQTYELQRKALERLNKE